METRSQHWNQVYQARDEDAALTWFEAEPSVSRELILARSEPHDPVIDIGGGASRLVDVLIGEGYGAISVLDVSEEALQASRDRLGARAEHVTWIVADITEWTPPSAYAVWHDRAVFHFLTEPADRAAYVTAMTKALRPGGTAIISTFAEDGPEKCSGLPVVRYAPADLAETIDAIAPGVFRGINTRKFVHLTPKGSRQNFQVSVYEKLAPS